jgi:hypothetical protein
VLAVLDPAVHAGYRSVVARVAAPVERSLGAEVVGGRCTPAGSRFAMEPWRSAWRRHQRRIEAIRGPALRLDVRDCFGSIRPEVVDAGLMACGVDREAARAVRELLVRFEASGIRGLPVGPEPSALLANAALAAADRALRALGLPFVRWCDDVTIALGSADPALVEQAWAAALAPLGLDPAPEKARVTGPGEPLRTSGVAMTAASPPVAPTAAEIRSESYLAERAIAAADGPDPHAARTAVARLGGRGGRAIRSALRHVRRVAPHLSSTAEWGLRT